MREETPLRLDSLYLPPGMHHEFHAISSIEGRMRIVAEGCIVEYVRIGMQRIDMNPERSLDAQSVFVTRDDCPIWVGVRNVAARVLCCRVTLLFRGAPRPKGLPEIIRRHDDAVRDARHTTLGHLERRRAAMPSGILSPDLLKREKPN